MYDILELNKKLVPELREIAKELKIKRVESYKKQDLVYKILDTQAIQEAEKKERKMSAREQDKEDKSKKASQRKPSDAHEGAQKESYRGKRPRRERVEPVIKHERVTHSKKKTEKKESGMQSRQDQIKAIIKGFNRDKTQSSDTPVKAEEPQKPKTELKPEPVKEVKKEVVKKEEAPVQPVKAKTEKVEKAEIRNPKK